MHLSRTGYRRFVVVSATAAIAASLLVGASPAAQAAPKPPPPPKVTQGQVNSADAAKAALAVQVGQLGGQIAQAQAALELSRGRQELAQQKVALAFSRAQQAKAAARVAQGRVQAANRGVDRAHAKFVEYVQATYMGSELSGTAGSLLTANSPSALLDRSALEQYAAQSQVSAITNLQRATVTRSNAEAASRRAVQKTANLESAARVQKRQADDEVAASRVERANLQASLNQMNGQLTAAREQLATLQGQKSVYDAYVERQRQIALAKARAEAARRAAEARAAARMRAAAFARADAAARHNRKHHKNHGGGGGGGGGSYSPPATYGPSAPSGGGWTAAKGRRAVTRAMSTLGTPYAWAGGGPYGPSRGVCDASNGAGNDCNVTGYDCSGLTMYAWGKGWDHYAATQYGQAGSYHPGRGSLRPGDLLFWSNDGTVGGIHHIAIYKGGGRFIEAPYSGGYVQTNNLYAYSGYFGATRPLT